MEGRDVFLIVQFAIRLLFNSRNSFVENFIILLINQDVAFFFIKSMFQSTDRRCDRDGDEESVKKCPLCWDFWRIPRQVRLAYIFGHITPNRLSALVFRLIRITIN